MAVRQIPNFTNKRARLQRHRDSKFFSGWVADFTGRDLILKLQDELSTEFADSFAVELFGSQFNALFMAEQTEGLSGQFHFKVLGNLAFRPATESARVKVSGCPVSLEHREGHLQGEAVDVSLGGIALVLPGALAPNTEVAFEIATPEGVIRLSGRVRYCRPHPLGKNSSRVGLVLDSSGRIENARWRDFVEKQVGV